MPFLEAGIPLAVFPQHPAPSIQRVMKIGIALAALGLFALPAAARFGLVQDTAKVGAKIPAFSATAVATVDSNDVKVPTAYMIVGVTCGATPAYEKRFKATEDEFRSKGVDFFWVFPNKN